MRGKHVVTAIVVATALSGVLFARNRIAQEETARRQLAAGKQLEAAAKKQSEAKTESVAIATDKIATGKIPVAQDPVRISSRIVTLPRKKPMRWSFDLDGDGNKELFVASQKHAATDWIGQKEGAPQATIEVRSAHGKLLHRASWPGYVHGFWRRAVEVGGNKRVAMYQRSEPEDGDGEHVWIALVDGKVISKPFKGIPSHVIDVSGDGTELLVTLSHELYQHFFRTGTMDVLRWADGGWQTALPIRAFEVCALDPGMRRPIAFAAVGRDQPHRLHVLGWNAKPQMYVSRQQIAVGAPDDGTEFAIEQGFALHCMASIDGGTDQHVQYKNRHFAFHDARLAEVTKGKAEK